MSHDPQASAGGDASQGPEWQQALDELERSLHDASRAVVLLRHSLERGSPGASPARAVPRDTGAPVPPSEPASPAEDSGAPSPFERVWDRIEHERREKQAETSPEPAPAPRGLDLLPQQYLMTVEDRESRVDLVPLHRALLSLAEMGDVSLVSFANGVPVISLRVEGELDLDRLGDAVSTAMDRDCEVISQDTGRLYLRMQARKD